MVWTIFLIIWLALCLTGLVASGYGFYELVFADRPAKPKQKAKEQAAAEEPAVVVQPESGAEELEVESEADEDLSAEIEADEDEKD